MNSNTLPKINSRELLRALFYEATLAEQEQLTPKLKTDKTDASLSGAKRKKLDTKLKELSKILSEIGVTDLKDRLTICNGSFVLQSCGTCQHEADSSILFDLTKISPLIDKGYVVIDAEADECCRSITILASDTDFDFEIPDSDDLEAVKFDNGKEETRLRPEYAQKLAETLVRKILTN